MNRRGFLARCMAGAMFGLVRAVPAVLLPASPMPEAVRRRPGTTFVGGLNLYLDANGEVAVEQVDGLKVTTKYSAEEMAFRLYPTNRS